jgi:uncharacterized membrane protein YbhN (UPF0104 family)
VTAAHPPPEPDPREKDADAPAEERIDEHEQSRRLWAGIVTLVVLMAIIAGLIAAVPGLDSVERQLARMSPGWIAAAIVLELLSCAGYVLAFQLVFARAPRRFARRVALAELAFGAVVPVGGAGGVAIGAWMLRAKQISWGRIARRSAALFLVTSLINVVVLVPAGIAFAIWGGVDQHVLLGLVPAAVGVLVIVLAWELPRSRHRLGGDSRMARLARGSVDAVEDTWALVLRPRWRLIGVPMYLLCDIAVLGVCLRAVGTEIDVSALALGYLIGYLGNLLPVPGGIGVLDGGLIGALALYGTPPDKAAAAVLVYHAIALWLPTLVGAAAFIAARRTLHDPIEPLPAEEEQRTWRWLRRASR